MKINDNTKLKVRIPKNLYESVKKELAKKKIQECGDMGGSYEEQAPIEEDAVDYAWVAPLAALLGIAKVGLSEIVAIMKEKNLTGLKGLATAYKEYKLRVGDVAKKN